MNNPGDSAEQIVRMSLDGAEFAAKITGSAAKNIAALLYTILKNRDKNKIKGRARLVSMLKSGKPLTVFTVSENNLKQFTEHAKQYGIVYCAMRNKKADRDGTVDVFVRAEDASRINKIVERFKLAAVDTGSIKSEIEQSKEKNAAPAAEVSKEDALLDELLGTPAGNEKQSPEKDIPTKSKEDMLLDEVIKKPQQKEQPAQQNPNMATTEKSPPSEPTSKKQTKTAKGTTKPNKASVSKELKDIKNEQEKKAELPAQEKEVSKSDKNKAPQHKQPGNKKKSKKKSKGR